MSSSQDGDDDYRYDFFVSYRHTGGEFDTWVERLCRSLADALRPRLGRPGRYFLDADVADARELSRTLSDGLRRSKVLLAILTPQFFASPFCVAELQAFEERERMTGAALIVPIALGDASEFPERTRTRALIHVERQAIHDRNISPSLLQALTKSMVRRLEDVPAYDSRSGEPLSSAPTTQAVGESDGHRILLLAANPLGTTPLVLEVEMHEILSQLDQRAHRDFIVAHAAWGETITELGAALHRYKPTIVHFTAHGATDGLFLVGPDHLPALVSGRELSELLRNRGVQTVVLSGCFNQEQAEYIARSVETVIGIAGSVSDRAALAFVTAFYRGLGLGTSVAGAFAVADAEVRLRGPAPPPDDGRPPFLLIKR